MTREKTTIKDIAEKTGLSLGCISKYLNGGSVKPANKKKIEEAILELDYKVDVYARAMKTGRTKSVAIIIPELCNIFYGTLATYMGMEFRAKGYEVAFYEHNWKRTLEATVMEEVLSRRYDGIVLVPCSEEANDYNRFRNETIVFFDGFVPGVDKDFVLSDNEAISRQVAEYLVKKGHHSIAGLFCPWTYTGVRREVGFKKGLISNNVDPVGKVLSFDGTVEGAYQAVARAVESHQYSALFASSYIATLGAIFYLNERGTKIPEDISIVGFDNMMLTDLFKPKLTIVNQPLHEISKEVVKVTLESIEGERKEHIVKKLKCTLSEGSTVMDLNGKDLNSKKEEARI